MIKKKVLVVTMLVLMLIGNNTLAAFSKDGGAIQEIGVMEVENISRDSKNTEVTTENTIDEIENENPPEEKNEGNSEEGKKSTVKDDLIEGDTPKEEIIKNPIETSEFNDEPLQVQPMLRSTGSVGQVIIENSNDGTSMNFLVLSENAVTMTGTVEVGNGNKIGLDGRSTASNGINKYPVNGLLEIPNTIEKNGYTYTVVSIGVNSLASSRLRKLTLPTTLTHIREASIQFNTIEILEIPKGVKSVEYAAFVGNGSLKTVKFPSTIETLGRGLFVNCKNINTIYFPVENATIIEGSVSSPNVAFAGLSVNDGIVVVDTQEQYEKWRNDSTIINSNIGSSEKLVTREIDVEFYDKNSNKLIGIPSIKKLLGKSIASTKQIDGEWKFTRSNKWTGAPDFPSEESLGYKPVYWGLNEIAISTVNASGDIKESNLNGAGGYGKYFNVVDGKVIALEEELISIASGISKTFDNEAERVSINFNREIGTGYFEEDLNYLTVSVISPKEEKTAQWYSFSEVPVLIGATTTEETFKAGFKNVADSGSYSYKVRIYDKKTGSTDDGYVAWMSDPFGRAQKLTVEVSILPADITITPILNENEIAWASQRELPKIALTEGDTLGEIAWDAGEIPELGTKDYTYTFVPKNLYADGVAGTKVANYTEHEKKGSIRITYKNQDTQSPTAKPDVKPVPTIHPNPGVLTPLPQNTKTNAVVKAIKKLPPLTNSIPAILPTRTPVGIYENKIQYLENKATGVTVESIDNKNIFDRNEKIFLVDSEESKRKQAEQKLKNIIRVFDIYRVKDGVKIETKLDSKIRVSIETEEYNKYRNFKVYTKNNNNTYTELNHEVKGAKIIFECDVLDTYVLTGIRSEFPWWIIIASSCVVAVGTVIFMYIKKKNEEEDN